MSPSKTEGPTTLLTFLGIEIDTLLMIARLSPAKLSELQSTLLDWITRTTATVKELQSVTGVLTWCAQVVRPGRAYLRRIITHSTSMLKTLKSRAIPKGVRADLLWWHSFAADWNGTSLLLETEWTESPSIELFTDACETGYGGVFGHQWIAGTWSKSQLSMAMNHKSGKLSMPYLELLALVIAVCTWGPSFLGRKLRSRSD